tara:strand:- start:33 stop:278 length:246 start_codon:yes stop_codon:yes gene_type:complete
MTNVNDLQSMERFIDKKIEPLNKQISMLQIELSGVKQQLSIPRVSQQRELLNALADDFNNSTDTYVGQTRIEEVLKAFNCG